MILILFNLLKLVLWLKVSWEMDVPCVHEKDVFSAVAGPSVLQMAVRTSWLIVLKSCISFTTFFLNKQGLALFSGWSAVVQFQLIAASTSQTQVTVPPQPPE